ncbi:WD domain, G-beta repeat-containing protein [Tothia fuscella]|uniref:WD domain, G-beta repeat-containing protein n=1 Tax=Tothia fuscella TaxID=1048955 RepID=A0A9P4TYG0_9PEZI|nr:WD domain, G-beta repeat-containing protein [Tothia fuscella]
MAKRKREFVEEASHNSKGKTRRVTEVPKQATATYLHLITGSYERTLHGIIATIPSSILSASNVAPTEQHKQDESATPNGEEEKNSTSNGISKKGPEVTNGILEKEVDEVTFADSFLFNAHTSAIRCLALSPIPKPDDAQQKVILATGGTDERINLYHISPSPPVSKKGHVSVPSLSGASISQNPRNRELGSLLHHSSSITALYFPSRSKLLSSAEDNTIAVSRTRDWNVLSTIKAPIPKPVGRPSGDTAAPGEVPAGVNDFAVHPSMKLMLSVGKGERSMRLWNLVTGKKAGVLNFDRDVLQQVGEGKYGTGEGRRILWDASGEEFVVGFERGACVYDIESKPKAKLCPSPLTKIHQMHYVPGMKKNILAVSTEDGRILFYNTSPEAIAEEKHADIEEKYAKLPPIPEANLIVQLGGKTGGLTTRIKDFEILILPQEQGQPTKSIIITAGSDGTVRLWFLLFEELFMNQQKTTIQVGQVLAKYDTGNRITCLKAFVMTHNGDLEEGESEGEFKGLDGDDVESSSATNDSD